MDIDAKLTPLSKVIRELNKNPDTRITQRQEKHIDIITEELAVLSQDLGIDMVIYTVVASSTE